MKIERKVFTTVATGKTSTGVRGKDFGIEESNGKEIGGRRNANAELQSLTG